ncbi:hypothetical protein AX16_002336 [Volvariella volvacea WC 439]|nr:hypothetical protein AX16_002336 [Volvariella volvacea WC 439]
MSQPEPGDAPVAAVLQPITNDPAIGNASAANGASDNVTEVAASKVEQPGAVVDDKPATIDVSQKVAATEPVASHSLVDSEDVTGASTSADKVEKTDALEIEDTQTEVTIAAKPTDTLHDVTHVNNEADDTAKPSLAAVDSVHLKEEVASDVAVETPVAPSETGVSDDVPTNTPAQPTVPVEAEDEPSDVPPESGSSGNKQISESLAENEELISAVENAPTQPEPVKLRVDKSKEGTVEAAVESPKVETSGVPVGNDAEITRGPEVAENVLAQEQAEKAPISAIGADPIIGVIGGDTGVQETVVTPMEAKVESVQLATKEPAAAPASEASPSIPQSLSTEFHEDSPPLPEAPAVSVTETPAASDAIVEEVTHKPEEQPPQVSTEEVNSQPLEIAVGEAKIDSITSPPAADNAPVVSKEELPINDSLDTSTTSVEGSKDSTTEVEVNEPAANSPETPQAIEVEPQQAIAEPAGAVEEPQPSGPVAEPAVIEHVPAVTKEPIVHTEPAVHPVEKAPAEPPVAAEEVGIGDGTPLDTFVEPVTSEDPIAPEGSSPVVVQDTTATVADEGSGLPSASTEEATASEILESAVVPTATSTKEPPQISASTEVKEITPVTAAVQEVSAIAETPADNSKPLADAPTEAPPAEEGRIATADALPEQSEPILIDPVSTIVEASSAPIDSEIFVPKEPAVVETLVEPPEPLPTNQKEEHEDPVSIIEVNTHVESTPAANATEVAPPTENTGSVPVGAESIPEEIGATSEPVQSEAVIEESTPESTPQTSVEISQNVDYDDSAKADEANSAQDLPPTIPVVPAFSEPLVDSTAVPIESHSQVDDPQPSKKEGYEEIPVEQVKAEEVLSSQVPAAVELGVISTPADEVLDNGPQVVRPVTPLQVETEIERPKSPWTPSLQVTTVGRSVSSEPEVVEDTQDDSLNIEDSKREQGQHEGAPVLLNVSDTSTPHVDTEHEAVSSGNAALEAAPEASAASSSLEVPRPWTPSYSVHSQGSPIQKPADLEAEQPVNEAVVSDKPEVEPVAADDIHILDAGEKLTEEVPSLNIAPAPASDAVHETSVEATSNWTPSFSVHTQGASEQTADEQPIPEASTHEPVQSAVDEVVINPQAKSSEKLIPVDSVEATADAPQVAETTTTEASWTSSYSVHAQGTPAESPIIVEESQTAPEPVLNHEPQNSPSTLPEVTMDAPAETAKSAATVSADPVEAPWAASYSVHSQGTPLQTPVEVDEHPVSNLEFNARSHDEAANDATPETQVEDTSPVVPPPSNTTSDVIVPSSTLEASWTPSYSVHAQGTPLQRPIETSEQPIPEALSLNPEEELESSSSAAAGDAARTASGAVMEPQWTPSYSVHSQGSESPSLEQESQDSHTSQSLSETPQLSEAPTPAEPNASELVTTALDVQRPWTPSYSIHSQGSPLQKPVDIEAEYPVAESLSLSPQPPAEELPVQPAADILASSAPFDNAKEALEAPRPWTPSYSVHAQGSPQNPPVNLSLEQPFEEATKNEQAEVAEEPVTIQRILSAVPPAAATASVPALKVSTEPSVLQQPIVLVEDDKGGISTPLDEPEEFITANEPSVSATSVEPEQVRSQSPSWVPSYSVSQQGSPAPVQAELPAETEPQEAALAWVPSYSVSRQGSPAPVHAALPEESIASAAGTQSTDDSQPTATNIVVTLSPLTTLMTEAAKSKESLREPAVVASDEPGPRVPGSWTPSYSVTRSGSEPPLDKFEPLPASLVVPEVVVSESSHAARELSEPSTLVAEDGKHTREGTSGSVFGSTRSANELLAVDDNDVDDDVPPLDTSQIIYRPRLESTTSSRFFPGGWFSSPSKIVDEGRTSLDVAQGEFIASKPTSPVEAADAVLSDEDNDNSEAPGPKKSRWCVIM